VSGIGFGTLLGAVDVIRRISYHSKAIIHRPDTIVKTKKKKSSIKIKNELYQKFQAIIITQKNKKARKKFKKE
jgi:hypothetical protein